MLRFATTIAVNATAIINMAGVVGARAMEWGRIK
jgi:hypothetical protein